MFWMAGFYVNSLFCPSGFNMYLSLRPSVHHTLYYLVLIGTPPSQRSPSDDCSGYECQIVVPLIHLSVKKCGYSGLFFPPFQLFDQTDSATKSLEVPFLLFYREILPNKTVWLAASPLRHLVFFVKVCSFVYGNAYKHASYWACNLLFMDRTVHNHIHHVLVLKLSNRCFCVDLLCFVLSM